MKSKNIVLTSQLSELVSVENLDSTTLSADQLASFHSVVSSGYKFDESEHEHQICFRDYVNFTTRPAPLPPAFKLRFSVENKLLAFVVHTRAHVDVDCVNAVFCIDFNSMSLAHSETISYDVENALHYVDARAVQAYVDALEKALDDAYAEHDDLPREFTLLDIFRKNAYLSVDDNYYKLLVDDDYSAVLNALDKTLARLAINEVNAKMLSVNTRANITLFAKTAQIVTDRPF